MVLWKAGPDKSDELLEILGTGFPYDGGSVIATIVMVMPIMVEACWTVATILQVLRFLVHLQKFSCSDPVASCSSPP